MLSNIIEKKILYFILDKINFLRPNFRKPQYKNKYYLEKILFILKSGCSFRDANLSTTKNHYSSIHKKYLLWTKIGVFKNLYQELTAKYSKRFIKRINKKSFLELFIDSTNIRNKNGKQFIGHNYQDKFKKGNKITIICDEKKIPLSITFNKANRHDSGPDK